MHSWQRSAVSTTDDERPLYERGLPSLNAATDPTPHLQLEQRESDVRAASGRGQRGETFLTEAEGVNDQVPMFLPSCSTGAHLLPARPAIACDTCRLDPDVDLLLCQGNEEAQHHREGERKAARVSHTTLAMTRAERQRLADLLAEIDAGATDEDDNVSATPQDVDDEADKALALNEMRRQLRNIDARLANFSTKSHAGGSADANAQAQVRLARCRHTWGLT